MLTGYVQGGSGLGELEDDPVVGTRAVGARSVVVVLRPEPQSVPLARSMVREALADTPAAELSDAAELCVSELVTNAVLHAGTDLHLELAVADQVVRLSVRDGSTNAPVLTRHTRTASTGRGLAMVAAIAAAWGVEEHDGTGKTVWCELTAADGVVDDLDIADVMDAWELSSAEVAAADDAAHAWSPTAAEVVLAGYPVRLGLQLQEHYEAVVRECQLLAAHRGHAESDVPARLRDLAHALARRYTDELSDLARPDPRRLLAQTQGLEVVELSYAVTPEQMQRLQEWQQILDDVDEFSRRGDLLVQTITPVLARLRGWALREFVRQCAGAVPRPWQGPLT